jgi:hypothetical protein
MPEHWSGGGYHVVLVYELDLAQGRASVGDLADLPISLSLQELAVARARIGKQKHRLLGLTGEPAPIDLAAAWSALAEAALPDEVAPLREAKQLLRHKAELFLSEGARGRESYVEIRSRLDQLAEAAAESFPLPQAEIESLLQGLSQRVGELHRLESQAAAALDQAARRDQP